MAELVQPQGRELGSYTPTPVSDGHGPHGECKLLGASGCLLMCGSAAPVA